MYNSVSFCLFFHTGKTSIIRRYVEGELKSIKFVLLLQDTISFIGGNLYSTMHNGVSCILNV